MHSEREALSALLTSLRRSDYRFTTITPLSHQRVLQRPAAGCDLRDAFGWSRPFARGLLPAPLFAALQEARLLVAQGQHWKSLVRVSSLGNDLFVHSAFPTVEADAVFFGPDSYRFARAIRDHLRQPHGRIRRAVDIGAGAGVGGVVVARNADCGEVMLVDINDRALNYARINVAAAGLTNVGTRRSNLLDDVPGEFDLIVANPPYLNDALGRTYRNGGGALGSALSVAIAKCAVTRLAAGGSLLLYTGAPVVNGADPLLAELREAFAGSDLIWSYDEIDPDVFGEELDTEAYRRADRIAAVALTARKPGGA